MYSRFCVRKTNSGVFMYLPIIIIVIVVLITTTTLLGFGISMMLSQFKESVPQSLETVTLRNSIDPGSCNPDT